MRSTSFDDATTRARIRDAAIDLFGRDGFRETTVRAIAAEAGVSAGLVIHHFGSKDGLRQACNDYIMAEVTAQGDEISEGGPGTSDSIRNWLAEINQHRPWLVYFARLLTDGSEVGDKLFDDLVAYTERMFDAGVANGTMRESSDPHMRAVLLAAYGLSVMVFERQIGRAIGQHGLTATAASRMTIPAVELYTHGLYTDDSLLRAAREATSARPAAPASPARQSKTPPNKAPQNKKEAS